MKRLAAIVLAVLGILASPAAADNRNDHRNGDCRHSGDNCSDDDQLAVIVCVEPESCRFG